MNAIPLSFAGLLLLSVLNAGAAGIGLELAPFAGARFGGTFENDVGDEFDLDAGLAYGLVLDFAPDNLDVSYELLWSRHDSGIDFDGYSGLDHLDVTVDQFMIGAMYETTEGRFRENVAALVGATVFTPEGRDSEAYFCMGIGLGGKYYATKNLVFRLDLRGYYNFVESEGAFISTGGTTVIFFTGETLFQGEVSLGVSLRF